MTVEISLLIWIVILLAGILILNCIRLTLAMGQRSKIDARIKIDEEEYARHRKMTIGMFKWFQRLIGRLEEVENAKDTESGMINFGPARGVLGQPKPRKRLEDEAFIDYLKTMPCIYQIDKSCRKANEPHHDRVGYGDGKGSMSRRPDDYRAMRTDYLCHRSLHSTKGPRYRAMIEKISRGDVLEDQVKNLITWAWQQGWPMDEIYQVILDAIIDWVAKEK